PYERVTERFKVVRRQRDLRRLRPSLSSTSRTFRDDPVLVRVVDGVGRTVHHGCTPASRSCGMGHPEVMS
ncbi:MAG: hypothetical protein LC808_06895, partial [Actinobacteria bacterium]|nr:hypothetical protein [Actinomycetota bacterium]